MGEEEWRVVEWGQRRGRRSRSKKKKKKKKKRKGKHHAKAEKGSGKIRFFCNLARWSKKKKKKKKFDSTIPNN